MDRSGTTDEGDRGGATGGQEQMVADLAARVERLERRVAEMEETWREPVTDSPRATPRLPPAPRPEPSAVADVSERWAQERAAARGAWLRRWRRR